MFQGDGLFSIGTTNTLGRLEKAKGEPGRASGALGNQRVGFFIHLPFQSPAPLLQQGRQFLGRKPG